jgi:hypothetical protein
MAAQPEHTPETPTTDDPPAQLSRAERRAAARGKGPTQKVHGPANARLTPPPAKSRNYAARKGG